MANVTMTWYGPQVLAKVKQDEGRRVEKAGRHLKNKIRIALSGTQPTRISKKTGRKYGLDPSKPGDYPKKVTGYLRQNIQSEYNPATITSRVGTKVYYGVIMELSTNPKRRRPWLLKTLVAESPTIKRILEQG